MWKFILGICAAMIVAYLAWWLLPEFREREDPLSAEHLSKIAAGINRAVPVMIDAETELLPAEGRQGMLIYIIDSWATEWRNWIARSLRLT